jgi:hypothetical protein
MSNRNFAFIFLALALGSCLKRESYPDTPAIVMREERYLGDSAYISIDFTDGDGDFGLNAGEFEGENYDCARYYNVFMKYFELNNGVWELYELDPCIDEDYVPYYFRVPYAEPTGQNKTQKGFVEVEIGNWAVNTGRDTCRFEIYFVDRAQNRSNVIYSKTLVKPD